MKLKNILISSATILALAACTEDKYELGIIDVSPEDLVEGVGYSVTHDSSNPNIVYLKSLLPGSYNVAWETPQGRIVGQEATLKIAFDGDYEFRMAVDTRGGYVWSNPGHFTITDFCADFVSHYLWTRLTGGVGNSKLWQVDLQINDDGSNKTTRFKGPHWFWNINYTWDKLHAPSENESVYNNFLDADPWDPANAIDPTETGADDLGSESNWYWAADFAGNSWMCEAQNYGFMELSLNNGANCTVYDADMNVVGKGTFLLDTDNHTLSFSDVFPLWTTNSNPASNGSRSFRVLYLSDDALMMYAPGYNTGINYVTKDYFDNYQEAEAGPQEPTLPDGWEDLVSQVVVSTTTIKWTLSDENPTDWCNLDGTRMNGWNTIDDYTNCGWYGTPNPSAYANFSMTLDSENNTATFEYPDGTKVETTYTLNEKGIYTFGDPIPSGLSGMLGDWDSFYVDSNNQLRIMSIEKKAGQLAGMWLGARSDDKDEYHAYHFIPNLGTAGGGGGQTSALNTKYYDFNSANVNFYNDSGFARISLNNPWGDPADDALDCAPISWTNNFTITFRLSGTPAGFSGKAGLSLNKNDWSIVLWAPDNLSTNVSGDGVYTVTYDAEPFGAGDLMMCAVEISNLDAETEGLEVEVLAIASDVNGTQWTWNPGNVNFYNDSGFARISMNNPWGDPADDAIDCAPINWNNTFAVTFRLTGTPAGFSGKAGLSLNKNDWSIVLWAPDNLSTNVSGDGVYTVTYDAEPFGAGDLMMFAVEISNLDAETDGLKAEIVDIRTW